MIKKYTAASAFFLCLATAAAAQSVVTYHNSVGRSGAYKVAGLTTAAAASVTKVAGFAPILTGHIYAQPLYWKPKGAAGELIVATESNFVYALNATTGAVIWHTQLAAPATSGLPCGNISPEGVDGTPTIDPATGTLYLDALTQTGGNFRQMVYAISLADGSVVSGWPLDVQAALASAGITFSSGNQGERSAMLLYGGELYAVYGGKYGDCTPYNGTVIELDPAAHTLQGVWQTRASGGGIWAQGGVAGDAKSLYVTTGNTFTNNGTYGDGESIERLAPGLARSTSTTDYYAPANWLSLDNSDLDLGGTEALPVSLVTSKGKPSPHVIALGKDGNAYLVNRNNLGGIGGPATIVKVSNSEIITGPAIYSTSTQDMVAFTNPSPVGCSGAGIMMLKLVPGGGAPISVAWCAAYNGNGSPIVTTTDGTSNPIVWVVGAEGDNELHGFNALTGAVAFSGAGTTMSGLRHFQTMIVAGGRFYVAADGTVYAFSFTKG
jgi:outer membrane protein assembly factor BamB